MEPILRHKNKLIISCVILSIIIFALLSNSSRRTYNELKQAPTPAVDEAPGGSQQYIDDMKRIHIEEKEMLDQSAKAGALLNLIPYQGANFKLDYDYKRLTYVLTLKNERTVEGNQEFDSFLRSHDIADRSWFSRLEVSTE